MNNDEYNKANQELYDEAAKQFREACINETIYQKGWQKEIKQRMRILDFRLKNLGET